MECNMNELPFDTYFAALLTPIELPGNDNLPTVDKLPPIHTLGATHAGLTNLFSSTNNDELAESANIKPIKNEELCSGELSSSSNFEDNFLEETVWIREEKITESFVAEVEVNIVAESPISNSIYEEDAIALPVVVAVKEVVASKVNKEPKKTSKKKSPKNSPEKKKAAQKKGPQKKSTQKKESKEKKSLKRARSSEESSGISYVSPSEVASKKRRTNYCFDIHRIYCPTTKKEKYYCNVTLQGKLQQTVDLVKGKRGKYAYTFYDHRKRSQERRYWPSQSCGPVIEDNCSCKCCTEEAAPKKTPSVPEVKREISTSKGAAPSSEDNCVLVLEDVFLDM